MQSKYVIYALILIAVFTAGALCGDMFRTPAMAQEETTSEQQAQKADEGEEAEEAEKPKYSLEKAPVVATEAYEYETEYEMDPFEPDRIRTTTTEVKRLVIVREDGTTEIIKP